MGCQHAHGAAQRLPGVDAGFALAVRVQPPQLLIDREPDDLFRQNGQRPRPPLGGETLAGIQGNSNNGQGQRNQQNSNLLQAARRSRGRHGG